MDTQKIKDALQNLKEAFLSKEKFTDAKLADGTTIIRYDAEELAIGVPVMVVSDAGALAIPDGDYVTDMGDKFTTVGGVVTAYVEAPEPVEVPEPTPAQAMTEAQAKSIIESVIKESHFVNEDFVITKVAELIAVKDSEIETLKTGFATQKDNSEKELKEIKEKYESINAKFQKAVELIEKIAEMPSTPAAETPKTKVAFDLHMHKKAFKEDLDKISSEQK